MSVPMNNFSQIFGKYIDAVDPQTQNPEMVKSVPMSGSRVTGNSGQNPFGTIDTSFKTIYNDLFRFKKVFRDKSAGFADQLFGALDQPGHYYFKLFFYFSNPYSDPSNPMSSNLLGTTYSHEDAEKSTKCENTALNYLYNNKEYTRFNYLAEFIQLLSDISTKSPWYFQQITGLDQAVERQEVGQRDFKLEEERKSITIKCLPDAYDNRIGRMLDLYRTVVWSQNLKKWILPRNLRKFDMGIYVFNSPIKTITGGRFGLSGNISDRVLETTFNEYYGTSKEDSGKYERQMYKKPVDMAGGESSGISYKYIELRGCEIDYNSSKSAYTDLDNAEGKPMEYEIVIKYDTAVEDRYDPIFNNYIGDFVIEDLMFGSDMTELRESNQYDYMTSYSFVDGSIGNPYGADSSDGVVDELFDYGMSYIQTFVNKILLGNIYGFSFSNIANIVESDPINIISKVRREKNNASLIQKRIEDFISPDKGTKELEGKNLHGGWIARHSNRLSNDKLPGWNDIPDNQYTMGADKLPGWDSNQRPAGIIKNPDKFDEWPEVPDTEVGGDLDKLLPGYPGESTMESGDLPKNLPDYPVESTMESGDLPKKFPGNEP